jgi:glycosyltransferase involved in cell wall biosynthesis
VHVLYLIDSLTAGGAERSLAAMAPYYRDLGVRLDVAYLHDREGVGPALEAAGATLCSLAGTPRRDVWARRAIRLVRERRPDLLHTTLFEADVVGRIASVATRVPVVCSLVNVAYGPEQLADPRLRRSRVRAAQAVDVLTARRVRRFHAVSSTVATTMAARLRVSASRIDVIPRGRDGAALGRRTDDRRRAARAALGLDDATPMLLAVGRQEYQKGFDVLPGALRLVRAAVPDARLFVAGREGNATVAFGALAHQHGVLDAIEVLGARDDVPDLMAAADVFVFPSRWEGMPGTIIEAMALEVPIVASDIAPVREVVGDGDHARLVPVDDVRSLGDAVVRALADPAPREHTLALRQRFEDDFTVERVARRMVEFYERALR